MKKNGSDRQLDRREFIGAAAGVAAGAAAATTAGAAAGSRASAERLPRPAGSPHGVGSTEPMGGRGFPASAQRPRVVSDEPRAGAWVELDREALVSNLAAVRAQAGGRPVMGVIKANGYGHGLVPVARTLVEAGIDALMVVTVDEALALRDAGIDAPVMNFGPYDSYAVRALLEQRIDQVVYTKEAVEGMAAATRRYATKAGVHVMVDTGLGRVGVPYTQAMEIFEAIAQEPRLSIVGTLTTLTEEDDFDREQLRRFLEVCEAARAVGIEIGQRHCASSDALVDFPEAHLDMVRPGVTLYGIYPNDQSREERPIDLTPALSLKAKVAYVKTVGPGDSIGYHREHTVEKPTKIVTLPIGYSEGYPRAAVRASGWAWIHDRPCELLVLTSNHLEVGAPIDADVKIGDTATLILGGDAARASIIAEAGGVGEEENLPPVAHRVAAWADKSVYQLVMQLNPLMPRRVV